MYSWEKTATYVGCTFGKCVHLLLCGIQFPQMLYEVIKTWPNDVYNAKAIIYAVNVGCR